MFREELKGYVADVDAQDEADSESFPASDPPASQTPGATEPQILTAEDRASLAAPARTAARCAVTLADGTDCELDHGHVVIAAITSCTNTSNPSVMLAAGLLARNALAKGLTTKPWVKTSLAPGSKVVTDYLRAPACRTTSTRSASTSSATAARPASATPARSRRRSPRPSTSTTSPSARCSRATATSRAASTPT